jgi:hypothetical protein
MSIWLLLTKLKRKIKEHSSPSLCSFYPQQTFRLNFMSAEEDLLS